MAIKAIFLILVMATVQKLSYTLLEEHLIVQFFSAKFCSMGTIFSCASEQDQIKVAQYLILNRLRISFFDLSNRTFSVENALSRGHNHLAVIVDADCDNLEPFLEKSGELNFFYNTYHWLVFGSTRKAIEKFRTVGLTVSSDVSVAVPTNESDSSKNTNWTIIDVYNQAYHHQGSLIVEDVGYYNKQNGYRVKMKGAKYYRRRNMTGTLFQTAMVIPENITTSLAEYMASDEERYNNTFSRFQSVVVRNCRDYYDFTMNISLLQSWGYEQPNGDVDGLVKELRDKRLDFGLAPLLFKLYRLKVLDYGYGSWIMKSVFLFRHPKSTATSYELYLRPLVTSVWVTTAATILLIVIILRLTVTKEMQVIGPNESGGETSWSFLLLYGIGEICQQGFAYIPMLPSGRIVIFIVLLFSFMIYQFYSASLVSFLLLEPPRTINTLADLLKSPLKAGCEDSLFDIDYLQKTTDPVAIKLYNLKIKGVHNKSHFLAPEDGLMKVAQGGYAFHTQTSTAYPIIDRTFMEKAICELAEVKMYATQHMHMSIQKHSPFKDMLNYCLAHQREVGVMERLRKFWDASRPECVDAANYFEITIGLEESYWALLLLGIGIIYSLMVLAIEHMWIRKREAIKGMIFRKNKKPTPVQPFVH